MLTLHRKLGESIDVTTPTGERITFTVVDIRRGKVAIGVIAPKEFPVHRREIQQLIDSNRDGNAD